MNHKTYPKQGIMRYDIKQRSTFAERLAWAIQNPMLVDCQQCAKQEKMPTDRRLDQCPHPQHAKQSRIEAMYDYFVRIGGKLETRCVTCNKLPSTDREGWTCPTCNPYPVPPSIKDGLDSIHQEMGQDSTPKTDNVAGNAVVEALGLEGLTRTICRDEIGKQGGLDLTNELLRIKSTGTAQRVEMTKLVEAKLEEIEKRAGMYKGIEIVTPTGSHKLDGQAHEAFEEALDLLIHSPNGCIYLCGPAGTGKTHMAEMLSMAFNLFVGTDYAYSCDSVNEGTPESYFTGWLLPTGDAGRFEFHETEFLLRFETGGVHTFDEFDRMDSNVASVANKAFDSQWIDLPKRIGSTRCRRHKDFRAIAIGNTVGSGGSSLYSACNAQDGATMNRFAAQMVMIDYDLKLEHMLAMKGSGGNRAAADKAVALTARMRDAIERGDLDQIASYRQAEVVSGQFGRAAAHRDKNLTVPKHLSDEAIRARCLGSWSVDEQAMVSA